MASSSSSEVCNTDTDKSQTQSQSTSWIEKLPREVYFDVLSRLPFSSLLESKLVSKRWHASVKDPGFGNVHVVRASENNLCVLFFFDWPTSKLYLVNFDQRKNGGALETAKILKNPFGPALPDFELVGSCNGLICLYNTESDDQLFVYNPFATGYRMLPRMNTHSDSRVSRVVFGFGFHPKTKEYKVIRIVYYAQFNYDFAGAVPEAFVLSFSNPTWRNIGRIPHMLMGPTSEALVNGKLHWLAIQGETSYRDIVSFDIETEEFQLVPQPDYDLVNPRDIQLVTLRGCLSLVVANEIWVTKTYNVPASWSKEIIIGDYVPPSYRLDMAPPFRRKKNGYQGKALRVLCALENGEILYQYHRRCLVSYNPVSQEFKDHNVQGLPIEFQAIVHASSVISVNTVLGGA
ncbi:hypothetical protein K2173_024393 [Erythroxylum novogranatense]|uniref:F-box domain-containing protein n=1 Tax=Erythroxylum novogranatense TaxID=1862640 RepID=A0AAV8SUF6_9ROSI|nr:hypothetical protein K2173_024393 [Erythroxylum novogranatense]